MQTLVLCEVWAARGPLMTRGDQIRAYIHGLSELLEQVDHEDMTVYLRQDEDDTRRLAEVFAQERSLGEWEN